jgi:hypothetical protein
MLWDQKGRSMFCMTEHEKYEQVGRLAEEYSQLKGELNHVQEKLNRAQGAYIFAGQQFVNLRIIEGRLGTNQGVQQQPQQKSLEDLLSHHELKEAFERRDHLAREVAEKTTRLRALAPHLL